MSLQHLLFLSRPLIVGTLHDAAGIRLLNSTRASSRKAARLPLDLLEARLDSLPLRGRPGAEEWPLPMIATARHPGEGGAGDLSLARRRALLEEAIPWASALDIELRSVKELSPVIASAHQHGRTVILSHHDFSDTPSLTNLKKLAARAADHGADLFKVAAYLRDQRDLQRLIEFQLSASKVPVTTMGMGPAGRFSRLVLCGFGAPLCYGWLGKPQVPGQWPALELAALLAGVLPA